MSFLSWFFGFAENGDEDEYWQWVLNTEVVLTSIGRIAVYYVLGEARVIGVD